MIPDITAEVEATMDLSGRFPKLKILDIDVGSVPGFVAELIDGPIASAMNEGLDEERFELEHTYELQFSEGAVTIKGR